VSSPPSVTRCGTIVLAGQPNVGKSTLLNALVGEPLAIVSAKPQSTRMPVIGLRTEGTAQMIFVDPAGLLDARYPLQEAMRAEALDVVRQADLILYLHPAAQRPAPPLATLLPDGAAPRVPTLTVLTKVDQLDSAIGGTATPGQVLASAVSHQGVAEILRWCAEHLPPGPFRHDPDDLSAQPVRFFVAEFVREAAFAHLGAELPYAIAAEVDEFREGSSPLYIRTVLYTERESQKGMVVGRGGDMIKRIGTDARRRIEAFLGTPVYLELRVKTLPKWRSRAAALRRLGFRVPRTRSP
jgi:GTP-binding protein Era